MSDPECIVDGCSFPQVWDGVCARHQADDDELVPLALLTALRLPLVACLADAIAAVDALRSRISHLVEIVTDEHTGEAVGCRCICGTTWNAPDVHQCPEVTP